MNNNDGRSPIGEDRYGSPIYLGDEVILVDCGQPCIMILARPSSGIRGNYIAVPRDKSLHSKHDQYNSWKPDEWWKIVSQERMKHRCIKI